MAYGVMQQHGGKIDVQSQVGFGSVFRVTLSLSQNVAAPTKEKEASSSEEVTHA